MALLQSKMHCLNHRTGLKLCPTMTTCRPFGRQRHSTSRPGAAVKLASRRDGHRSQTRMAVATEFPLPKLDRFEWDQMKLADLTGRACAGSSYGELFLCVRPPASETQAVHSMCMIQGRRGTPSLCACALSPCWPLLHMAMVIALSC